MKKSIIFTISLFFSQFTLANKIYDSYSFTNNEPCTNPDTSYFIHSACESYLWNGTTYTASGIYEFIIQGNECDSIAVLNLTIFQEYSDVDLQSACDSITWIDGITYTVSVDNVTHNLISSNGCDSSITLFLTIIESSPSITNSVIACDNYNWYGINYDSSGTYFHYSSVDEGCGIETLELEIRNSTESIDIQEHCGSYTWIDGITYYESNESATYTLTDAFGCDSLIRLNLTIQDSSLDVTTISACDSLEWNGESYNQSGTYDQILTNSNGCDSTLRLILEINTPSYSIDFQEHCNAYTWIDGITYTESNDSATYILTNSKGCDSIVELNFNISTNSLTVFDTATACGSYNWKGITYTESGDYNYASSNGCDSSVLSLTIKENYSTIDFQQHCESFLWHNGITYTESNNTATYFYTAQNGCDSLVTLNLDILNTFYTLSPVIACENYVWNDSVYSESGTYEQVITNSNDCDSTVQLNLTIRETSYSIDSQIHCQAYTWIDGITYFESNESATYTLTDAFGCDSVVTLLLEINGSEINYDTVATCNTYNLNGVIYDSSGVYTINNDSCSTTVLNLTIYDSFDSLINISTCQPYLWNDSLYNQSGIYTFNSSNQLGCDSVVTLNLTINSSSTSSQTITACDSFEWNGETYSESGVYTYSTNNTFNCDSTATLNLTINNSSSSSVTEVACDSFEWNGETYSESGVYTYSTTNVYGCDSTATLNLTINTSSSSSAIEVACDNFEWNGETYSESGVYTYSTTNASGCDSTATLNLTINTSSSSSVTEVACDNFEWNGETYTESGVYTYSTTNISGCDSTTTLNLTINNSSTSSSNVSACDSYQWYDSTYTTSGIYSHTYTGANGCDSILVLELNINPIQSIENSISISEGESYSVGNQTYSFSGTYIDTLQNIFSCDSIIITYLNVIPKTFNCNFDELECTNPGDGTGYFSSLEACLENCVTTIKENTTIDFMIYPNPFNSETNILFQNPNNETITISLIDVSGRILKEIKTTNTNKVTVEKGSLSKGIYFVQLMSKNYINKKTMIIE